MNKKAIISVAVILAVVLSWFVALDETAMSNSEYRKYIEKAESYAQEQLCQRAIGEYQNALTYEDTLDVRLKIIELYQLGIESGEFTSDGNLVSAILDMMAQYRSEKKVYEVACEYFYAKLDYEELANAIKLARKNEAVSERVEEIYANIKYHYTRAYATNSEPTNLTYGYYIVDSENGSYSMDSTFRMCHKGYEFISPFSADGFAVAKKDGRVFVINTAGVRQKYLNDQITASSGIANGRMACQIDGIYVYYDVYGENALGEFLYAGRFNEGVAAVMTAENEWRLINTNAKFLNDVVYEDIKLNAVGECVSYGVIFAKQNGKYRMLRVNVSNPSDLTSVQITEEDFVCDDCELPVDVEIGSNTGVVWFAFCKNDLWGYADCSGEVTITPQFVKAKSFSNGFAGVYDGNAWGFVDTQGNTAIQSVFSDVGYFGPNGRCAVQYDNGYWTYICMYFWQ